MAKKGRKAQTTWELEPHTKAKHEILRHYLGAWYPKLTAYNGRVVYIDGFAGPGIYEGGELGSPLVALDALLNHVALPRMRAGINFVFVEQKAKRLESLKAQLATRILPPNVTVETYLGAFDAAMAEAFAALDQGGLRLAPTLALIDPFGVRGVRMEHIKRFMATRSCEVLITFMSSRIHRFINTDEYAPHLDALFGSEDWRAAKALRGEERLEFIRAFFRKRLEDGQTGAGARYTRYFFMRDQDNRPCYELAFATNHKDGIDAMKDAMWRIDPEGGADFSSFQAKSQRQLVQGQLFQPGPDWEVLFGMLVNTFRGQAVPWPVVEEEIRRSPFRIMRLPIQQEARRADARFTITNPQGRALNEHAVLTFRP